MSATANPDADYEAPETEFSDEESAFDDSRSGTSSETTSITSSIFDYRTAYGRTYHTFGNVPYYLPNDLHEMKRLHFQHALFLLLFNGKLSLAPISSCPHDILDIGTGTGIWAINAAVNYPSARVTGTDLSPIQPEWVPPNCRFVIDDASNAWTDKNLDFIHCRLLHMALDGEHLVQQSFSALKPGGWLEIIEAVLPLECDDGTLEETNLDMWQNLMMEALRTADIPFDKPHQYQQLMEDAEFSKVEKFVYPIPLSPWPQDLKQKELGRLQMTNFVNGIEGFSVDLFTRYLNWSSKELYDLLADVKKDISNPHIHAYCNVVVVIGQKPPRE